MKFLLKVLVLLAVISLISAVEVERKHRKKHHLKHHKFTAESNVYLVDAGSSKTEVSCWKYNSDTQSLEKSGDKSNDQPPARLGDVFACSECADGADEKINAVAGLYADEAKKLVDALPCDGATEFYVFSTAGSRQQIAHNKIKPSVRTKMEAAVKLALEDKLKPAITKVELSVYAGRFEGWFGYSFSYGKHKDWAGDGRYIYYECGGSSCQLVFPSAGDACDASYTGVQQYNAPAVTGRFRKHHSKNKNKKIKALLAVRARGIMTVNPTFGLTANQDTKYKIFSNSWLGTGANNDALADFNGCTDAACVERIGGICKLEADAKADKYENCRSAIDALYSSDSQLDLTGEQVFKYQLDGAKAQVKCETDLEKTEEPAAKKHIDGKKILIQSGPLFFSALPNKGDTNLKALREYAQTTCNGAIAAATPEQLANPHKDFRAAQCIVACMYDSFLNLLLGLTTEAQRELVKINVIRDSNPAAGYFIWLKHGAGTTAAANWPWADTNKSEDAAYVQSL